MSEYNYLQGKLHQSRFDGKFGAVYDTQKHIRMMNDLVLYDTQNIYSVNVSSLEGEFGLH